MRLLWMPGTTATVACAALEETGAPYELVEVERHDRADPPELRAVDPHGLVPALLDGDLRLHEPAAIILHLGDRFPESPLAPPVGTPRRAEYYRWLAYLANTLHTAFTRWHAPRHLGDDGELGRALRAAGERDLHTCFDHVDAQLAGRDTLVPGGFTGADLLLHMLASPNWTLDLQPAVFSRRQVAALHAAVDARPAVQRMKAIHGPDRGSAGA